MEPATSPGLDHQCEPSSAPLLLDSTNPEQKRRPNGNVAGQRLSPTLPAPDGTSNGRAANVRANPMATSPGQGDPEKGSEKGGQANAVRVQVVQPQATLYSRASRSPVEKALLLLSAVLFAACLGLLYLVLAYPIQSLWAGHSNVCLTEECVTTASSLLSAIDKSADPCEDFFQFACGSWNKRHVIPEDKSSISTFEVMSDELQIILKGLLDEAFNEQDSNATRKAKLFYRSCMNTSQIQAIGDTPLKEMLDDLGGWPVTNPDWEHRLRPLETLLGRLRGDYNLGIIVEQWVGPDDKNSSVNIIQLDQMSLGLPSRDYFLKRSSQRELLAYHQLMVDIAELLGANAENASEEMRKVLLLEIELANVSVPEADRQDTSSMYSKLSLAQLQEVIPEVNWLDYLNTFLPMTVSDTEPVVVYAMSYLKKMGEVITNADQKLIMELLPFLGEKYQVKRAEFRKVFWGISAERERWNQCVELVNKRMGMAVGALFIRDNFNQESKETMNQNFAEFRFSCQMVISVSSDGNRSNFYSFMCKSLALEMIYNIREAFNELLQDNDWMDDETRQVAREKANAMNERIGYPELLTNAEELSKEYELLEIREDKFFQNILNAMRFEAAKNLIKLRQPVNKDKWTTEPAVVNAFYNPNKNDIVFPAGILQPLFYSQHFPKSLNYGGIGVVIGHEITHGFDDKGRQFDKDGNMKEWWNNKTIQAFTKRAQCIVDQYGSYILDEVGLPVNGKMTQGENIADNGGLKQSFRAYKKWVTLHGPEFQLPGVNLTHDQLFFLNYAQIWCGSMRPEDALSKIRSSVHSPGPIRILGPLSNSHDFAKAYSCPVGSRMNPSHKCSVW